MSSHSAVVPFASKRPRLSGTSTDSPNNTETSAETTLTLQSIRSKADALRQKLRKTVTSDSHAMTWFTANEMLSLDTPSQSCRELAEALYAEVDALFSRQSHKKEERRRTIMTNEVLVDAFAFLERAVLDTLGITSRRLNAIIGKHLSTDCLRKFRIEIMNVVHAENNLPIRRLLPKHGSDPSVLRLEITSDTNRFVNDKTFFYESTLLEDIVAKLIEKVPPDAFANSIHFLGMISKIPIMLEQCALVASMNVGVIAITCGDDRKQGMAPQELITAASAFASVNGLSATLAAFNNIDDGFLETCRKRGILTLDFYAMDSVNVSTNGVIDFCFGPTREGREHAERCIDELFYFDEALFHRILEATTTGEKLQHKITLAMQMQYDDPQETLCRLQQLLLQNYKLTNTLNAKEGSYMAVVEQRATVSWRLKICDNDEIGINCKVDPF